MIKGNNLDNKDFSNKVYVYTFILGILVVFVHSVNFADSNIILLTMIQSSDFNHINLQGFTGFAAHIENFLSNALGQVAVPGFFMMSGYLFFRTLSDLGDIGRKWKERFWSLIIPFGAWNIIYYVIYVCAGKAHLGVRELHDAIANYTYNPVFWYVYQLILLTLLAPVFYIILKNKAVTLMSIILFTCFVINGLDIPKINEDAIIYYFTGGAVARYGKTFFEREFENKEYIGIFMLILVWSLQIFTTVGMQMFLIAPIDTKVMGTGLYWYAGGAISTTLARFLKLMPNDVLVSILSVGGQVIVNVVRRLLLCMGLWLIIPDRLFSARGYMKNGFFLYAIHYPIARIVIFMLEYMSVGYHGVTDQIIRFLTYIIMPVICVSVAYRFKLILRKHVPFLWKVLSGGR